MMHKLLVIAVLALLVSLVPLGNSPASATILVVDDDGMASATDCNASDPAFLTISAAVAAAISGDTIKVCPGTYVENVILNKSLTLLGAQAGGDARGRVTPAQTVVPPPGVTTKTPTLPTRSFGSTIDRVTLLNGKLT